MREAASGPKEPRRKATSTTGAARAKSQAARRAESPTESPRALERPREKAPGSLVSAAAAASLERAGSAGRRTAEEATPAGAMARRLA